MPQYYATTTPAICDLGRRVAPTSTQQDAAQRVAERVAVAALERLHRDDGGYGPATRFDVDGARLEECSAGMTILLNALGSLHDKAVVSGGLGAAITWTACRWPDRPTRPVRGIGRRGRARTSLGDSPRLVGSLEAALAIDVDPRREAALLGERAAALAMRSLLLGAWSRRSMTSPGLTQDRGRDVRRVGR
jgi:hypothetical protein